MEDSIDLTIPPPFMLSQLNLNLNLNFNSSWLVGPPSQIYIHLYSTIVKNLYYLLYILLSVEATEDTLDSMGWVELEIILGWTLLAGLSGAGCGVGFGISKMEL